MNLELKESNSPFWLIGTGNNKTFAGSSTNIPCYAKSRKKQEELALQIFKNNKNVKEVYILTDTQWDNMPSGVKEEYGYIKNKGKLILSRNDIESTEEKEVKESNYPKGVSRDPLPKKGVKTYTSVATPLESKKSSFKPILKDTVDDADSVKESKKIVKEAVPVKAIIAGIMYTIDNWDTLKDIIETIKSTSAEIYEKAINAFEYLKDKGTDIKAAAQEIGNIITGEEVTESTNKENLKEGNTVSVDNIPEDLQDRFFTAMSDGRPEVFKKFTKDELKLFADFAKQLPDTEVTDFERNMLLVAISFAHGDDLTVEAVQNSKQSTGSIVKESKIVTPVGNPQTASSFVNIDVDLDHMEVSDFIVRLAQAIRSEQTSVLEYVALRSANGITNEDRAVIDGIIEEEKNHMVAFTTLLYKQITMNHQQNVEGANQEFVLPKIGMEIFDNKEEGKLTESISTLVDKIAIKEAYGIRVSDDFFIGNKEYGKIYHGLGKSMGIIQDMITKSGDEIVVQNVSIADSKKENIKLEDTFNSIDELINELKSDTNYDELAYHIHEYAKTNKARALELMDKLFELERNKSPKECRDALIAELETENKQYKTEEIKVSLDGETMSQTEWDVVVDVDYDEDFHLQVLNNLTNAIKELNKITADEHYGIATDKYTLGAGKFNFIIITHNAFDVRVTEDFVAKLCDKLFERASTYEYYIKRA